MQPLNIFAANNSIIIQEESYQKFDYYASLPPPPPYTPPLDNIKQNSIDPYGTDEALVSLQNVKDYLIRIKALSPMHDTTTKNFTDTQPMISKNTITNMTDLSINEGLERIGTTLQQLIDEAKASLSRIEKPSISITMIEETKIDRNEHNFVQKRYIMQEKKISVAFEQLEQSIEKLRTTTRNNNMINSSSSSSSNSSNRKNKCERLQSAFKREYQTM